MNLAFVRGIVRPVVLLVAVLSTIYFIVAGTSIPGEWWSMASVMVAYFFIERQTVKP